MAAGPACDTDLLISEHNFWKDSLFRAKVALLTLQRTWKNRSTLRVNKFTPSKAISDLPVIATSKSPLWNPHDNDQNRILTAGKVENLRAAIRYLDGLEIPAGETFSFWKQIGRPAKSRGYVVGREIREGCIVPTVAGGLCQLSNALYDAALQAGFEIMERHQHTKVVRGSLAEQGRDATVKWNYIDLRFRSKHSFRMVVEMTPEELIVSLHGSEKEKDHSVAPEARPVSAINDCYSCGNTTCFKHPRQTQAMDEHRHTTYIVDERWPELEQYLQGQIMPGDMLILPTGSVGIVKSPRYSWKVPKDVKTRSYEWQVIQRGLALRFKGKTNGSIPTIFLDYDQRIAHTLKKKIPLECRHVVIAQNLLPFTWKAGLLDGRTYDVLMTRLPMEVLHERLDMAHQQHSESRTLHDFRAPQHLIEWESTALNRARKVITPHAEIAQLFNHKVIKLHWSSSSKLERSGSENGPIVFPASALGRKGAHLVRQLAQDLDLEITVNQRNLEESGFWKDAKVKWSNPDSLRKAKLIIYPAYVEHQPRTLLKAIKAGIPVIASTATGLGASDQVTLVPTGDYSAFKHAVETHLGRRSEPVRETVSATV